MGCQGIRIETRDTTLTLGVVEWMTIYETPLSGLAIWTPPVLARDERGYFAERSILSLEMTYLKQSRSQKGVLRGLHYQSSPPQAKLIGVAHGSIYDVCVDIRPDSKTFGQWYSCLLDDESLNQVYVPHGFAHGFCALTSPTVVIYFTSSAYAESNQCGIAWDDPDLAIKWPFGTPILSKNDQKLESFAAYKRRSLTPEST
jgi:dTDP-4-dehydrorhamnose 3,5-epimerase